MGRWKAWALVSLLATLSALLASEMSAQSVELLVNGDFEDEFAGEWSTPGPDDAVARVCKPDGPVHGGECAGTLTCHGPQKCEVFQAVSQVGYGQDYELRGYIARSQDGPETLVVVSWYESSDGTGAHMEWSRWLSDLCPGTDDAPYDCLTTGLRAAPVEARSARIEVVAPAPPEGFTVYLDDFSFIGPSAPPATPTPSPTPPPLPTPSPSTSPTPSSGPMPSPMASPVPSPSPTAAPTATEVPSTATPSPSLPSSGAGLLNGGFEEADDEGKPLAWRKYGGELWRSAAASREGKYSAVFISRTASTKWAFQTVAVEGGQAYVLSAYVVKSDFNVEAAYLRLSWYTSPDGSGTAIESIDSTTRLTDDSAQFRFLTTGPVAAPAQAASAKVRLMLDPVSEAQARVYFDDISFEETAMPTPTPTAEPSPLPEEAVTDPTDAPTALPPPSGDGEGATSPPVEAPTTPADEPQPVGSPDALRPLPTVLGTTVDRLDASIPTLDEPSRSQAAPERDPTRTPLALHRERRNAEPAEAAEGAGGAGDQGDGLSPLVVILAMALTATAAAGAIFFVWQRWRRARPA